MPITSCREWISGWSWHLDLSYEHHWCTGQNLNEFWSNISAVSCVINEMGCASPVIDETKNNNKTVVQRG